jgi:hypothetical protein
VVRMGDLDGDARSELGVSLPGHQMPGTELRGAQLVFGYAETH